MHTINRLLKYCLSVLLIASSLGVYSLSLITFHSYLVEYPFIEQSVLEQHIREAKNPQEKVRYMAQLAVLIRINREYAKADSLTTEAIQLAEQSGDYEAIFLAYESRAAVFSWGDFSKAGKEKFISACTSMKELATKNKWKDREQETLLRFAEFSWSMGDTEIANRYLEEFEAIDRDALSHRILSLYHLVKADILSTSGETLLQFKNLLNAKRAADKSLIETSIALADEALKEFYTSIGQMDKARALLDKLAMWRTKSGHTLSLVYSLQNMAYTFADEDMSREEKLLTESRVISEKNGIIGYTIDANWGLWYLYKRNDLNAKQLKLGRETKIGDYLRGTTRQYIYDGTQMELFALEGNKDSSNYYMKRALAFSDSLGSSVVKQEVCYAAAMNCMRLRDYTQAISLLRDTYKIDSAANNLNSLSKDYFQLNHAYAGIGDFENAYLNQTKFLELEDSLRNMNKADELLKMELEQAEEDARLLSEREEAVARERHNAQYMGAFVVIIAMMIGLLLIGFLNVKDWVVRSLGFLSFIFLFEFIIILLDRTIHDVTHGEPLYIMLIKILIACVLVPLHHILEHRAIEFLQSKKLHRLKTVFKDVPASS